MKSPLEALSIELIEMVVNYLSIGDIGALRLTNRGLEDKASTGIFSTFFIHKNVRLTTQSLQDMIRVTGEGRPGRHLQYCTITGLVWHERRQRYEWEIEESDGESDEEDQKEQEEENKEKVALANDAIKYPELLTQAFNNLKQSSAHGGLTSLCFRVAVAESSMCKEGKVDKDGDYTHVITRTAVWDVAASTFSIVMTALEESQLLLHERLDVYGSVKGCSLSCDTFSTFVQRNANSTNVLRSMKGLTLSLSAPFDNLITPTEEGETAHNDFDNQLSHCKLTLQHILSLLQCMPELESLDLHWYDTGRANSTSTELPKPLYAAKEQFGSLTTPRLKTCSLRGIFISKSDLIHFLQTVQPVALTMIYVHLVSSGTLDDIFDHLTKSDTPIAEYYLDDICRRFELVHYDNIPGCAKFPYLGEELGPSTLTRLVGQSKEPIRYRFATHRPLGSPNRARWVQEKSDEFGSFKRHRLNFVGMNTPSEPRTDRS